jgi:hypothetical protein
MQLEPPGEKIHVDIYIGKNGLTTDPIVGVPNQSSQSLLRSPAVASEKYLSELVKFRSKMSLEMVLLALIERKKINLQEDHNPQFYLNSTFPKKTPRYRNFRTESLRFGEELQSFGEKELALHVVVDRRSRIFASCLKEPMAFGNLWRPDERIFILKGKFRFSAFTPEKLTLPYRVERDTGGC